MEAKCPQCEKPTLFTSEAVYEGFSKVGEVMKCTECGHEMADTDIEAASSLAPKPEVFGEEDQPESMRLVGQGDPLKTCRHCQHYVENPFTQRCSLHRKEVQATDSCERFEVRKEEDEELF